MITRIFCSTNICLQDQTRLSATAFLECSNLLSASALVLNMEDAQTAQVIDCVSRWHTPLFLVYFEDNKSCPSALEKLHSTLLQSPLSESDIACIIKSAKDFESTVLPAFSHAISEFIAKQRPSFACPGHQGGEYLDIHPAGVRFKQLVGSEIFTVDVPHATPELGDVLNHQGPIKQAEDFAAGVFNSDQTYFVLNGTSTANKIVTSALLTQGDFVLMDRNNHKSVYLGALVQSGANPVYLDNFRDDYGILGGYRKGALQEGRLRAEVAKLDEAKAQQPRPFRLAIVQHATCDGIIVDAGALLQRIGHLCDYVLFDSAWSGYEPFVDSLADKSPLHLPLCSDDPGILVTQSVHKQMSGFSQTSQIHKKDKHIQHLPRYCSGNVFNSAFKLHSSTSPFYPLFMSLEINAAIHADGNGRHLWDEAVSVANEFRKQVDQNCIMIKPYNEYNPLLSSVTQCLPTKAHYTQNFYPTSRIVNAIEGGLHYLDPCKVIFTTYLSKPASEPAPISIPASLITYYLREMNFTPEKSDFYNFTLLISPASSKLQLTRLMYALKQFELKVAEDALVTEVLPSLAYAGSNYSNLSLRALCSIINNLFQHHQIRRIQSDLFSSENPMKALLTPHAANQAFIRGKFKLVDIADALNKVAAEGVIPYPPGIMCIAPGECWNELLINYLQAIQALTNLYPEFSPHIQGAYYYPSSASTVILKVNVLDSMVI